MTTVALRAKLVVEHWDGEKSVEMFGPYPDLPTLQRAFAPVYNRLANAQARARNTLPVPALARLDDDRQSIRA